MQKHTQKYKRRVKRKRTARRSRTLTKEQYDNKVNNINEFFDEKLIDANKNPRKMKGIELLRKKELRNAKRIVTRS